MSADLPSSTTARSWIAATLPRFDYIFELAPWWWWKAQPYPFAYGATTMLALGLLLNIAGIGLFCWLIFTLAVYALPFFVGLNVFMLALHGGAGLLGAPIVGIAAGGITLAIGQTAFAMTPSVTIRAVVAALFAVPATFAGYQVVFAMSQIGVPSLVWREIFACVGAVFIGGTAWTRLTVFAETRPRDPGKAVGSDPRPALTAAAHQQ